MNKNFVHSAALQLHFILITVRVRYFFYNVRTVRVRYSGRQRTVTQWCSTHTKDVYVLLQFIPLKTFICNYR